jgi:hypothetical protein
MADSPEFKHAGEGFRIEWMHGVRSVVALPPGGRFQQLNILVCKTTADVCFCRRGVSYENFLAGAKYQACFLAQPTKSCQYLVDFHLSAIAFNAF